MNNIDLILANQFSIYAISLLIGMALLFFFNYRKVAASLILINWTSVVGVSALIYILIYSDTVSNSKLILFVIALELILLFFTTYFLCDLIYRIISSINAFISDGILKKLLFLSISISLYLLLSNPNSFGLLSGGSRIDYLSNGGLPLLLTYFSAVVQNAIIIVISTRLYKNKFSWLDILAFLITFMISLLSGSKGNVFMIILTIFILAFGLGYKLNKISLTVKILSFIVFSASIIAYIYLMSVFLNSSFEQSINLALSRFVLSADGRALASDSLINNAMMTNIHGNLLAEIFKGFSYKLGVQVSELPIGRAQYAAAYSIDLFVGANAGLSSHILTYYRNLSDLFAIFFCMLFIVVVIAVGYLTLYISQGPFRKLISFSFLFTMLLTFVQDFQAFVLTAELLFVWMLIIFSSKLIVTSVRNVPHKAIHTIVS